MINFIKNLVEEFMLKTEYEYHITLFDDYTEEFNKIIKTKENFKIYILDIEMPSKSGIDVARTIRRFDVNSIIIFLSGHKEFSDDVAFDVLQALTYIN